LRERDRGAATFAFQLLLYPMLDDRMTTVSSGWPDPAWSPTSNRYGWSSYVGHLGADVPGDAAPARASDLSGLPPTLVAVGALDLFSDEDIEYAVRLRHAGVSTDLRVYRGAIHGFLAFAPGLTIGRQATADIEHWLRAMIHLG
jgi:acetyl esterase/lipase